jgi:hypothetical protein
MSVASSLDRPTHSVAALPVSSDRVAVDRARCVQIDAGPVALGLLGRFENASSLPRTTISNAYVLRFSFGTALLYRLESGMRIMQGVVADTVTNRFREALGEEKLAAGSLVRFRARISAGPDLRFDLPLILAPDGCIHFSGEIPRTIGFKAHEHYSLSFAPAEDGGLRAAMSETAAYR